MNITRHQQLLSLIKRNISTVLRELDHESLHSAVVTNVILSNDGREAKIWVDATEDIIYLLNTQYRHDIQHMFMKLYIRKIVPRLVFFRDLGEIDRLEEMINKVEPSDE